MFFGFFKSSEFFGKLRKRLKSNFQMFLGVFKIFGKSSEVLGNLRKFSENFGNGSKVIFRCFYDFLKFPENLWRCSKIFGKFPDVIGNVRNDSQELKNFGAGFWEVLKRTPGNCCAQVIIIIITINNYSLKSR